MRDTLTITDNRTGKTYEIPIEHDTVRAMDLRQIKVQDDDFGMMTYDPGYTNTASCRSRVTYIDGDKGILEYRGYPIEQLAEHCTFLEVAYLLIRGELPNRRQLTDWQDSISEHTVVHENIKEQMASFRYDAHPMGMLVATVVGVFLIPGLFAMVERIGFGKKKEAKVVPAATPAAAASAGAH